MKALLSILVDHPLLHAKWLNTLSYLENCGARKIAHCEHPTLVKEEMLKHASEEFRHAHYLKRQLEKLSHRFVDYSLPTLLGGHASLHYLNRLEARICRYLHEHQMPLLSAYYFLTYAIELRAEKLYPLYEAILRSKKSPIYVKSIILEEKEHLEEMKNSICKVVHGMQHVKNILDIENAIYLNWMHALKTDLFSFSAKKPDSFAFKRVLVN